MQSRYQAFLLILASVVLILIFYLNFPIVRKTLPEPVPVAESQKSRFNFDFLKKKPSKVTLLVLGDIMLGRTVSSKSFGLGDPAYPFRKVGDKLKEADFVLANLEAPFVEGCKPFEVGTIFCVDPKMAEGLVYSGVDVVTVANNHIRDYGDSGVEKTKEVLSRNGILVTGLGELVAKKVGSTNFGFLGFNLVDRKLSDEDISLIKNSDSKVDILVVSPHWGAEYKEKHSTSQRQMAEIMIESGADIVVGHHPHWVQDFEEVNGKLVYYSLGNFVFDQMWSEKTRNGLAVKFVFDNNNLVGAFELPIYMKEWSQPEWVNKKGGERNGGI